MSDDGGERLTIPESRGGVIERIRRWIGGWTADAPAWWKAYRQASDEDRERV